MSNYAAGRRAEWKVRDWLLENGALFVARTAGSKSHADLVALFRPRQAFAGGEGYPSFGGKVRGFGGPLFIQVKRSKPSKKTAQALRELAAATGTRWGLVWYDRGIKSYEEFS